MRHISHIDRIAEAIADYRLCLFYIKAPDCGVCNVMLDKVGRMAENHPQLVCRHAHDDYRWSRAGMVQYQFTSGQT